MRKKTNELETIFFKFYDVIMQLLLNKNGVIEQLQLTNWDVFGDVSNTSSILWKGSKNLPLTTH